MCAKKTSKSKGNNNNERRKKNSIALERLILMFSMKHEHCSRQSRIQIYTQLCHFCLPVYLLRSTLKCYRMGFFRTLTLFAALRKKTGSNTHNKATKGFYKPFICNDVWLQSHFNRAKKRKQHQMNEKKKKTMMVMKKKKKKKLNSDRRQLVTLSSSHFIRCRIRERFSQERF